MRGQKWEDRIHYKLKKKERKKKKWEVADKDRETKGEQRERLLGEACSVTEPHKMGRGKNLLLMSSPLHPVSIFSSNPSGFLSGQKPVPSQGLGKIIQDWSGWNHTVQ